MVESLEAFKKKRVTARHGSKIIMYIDHMMLIDLLSMMRKASFQRTPCVLLWSCIAVSRDAPAARAVGISTWTIKPFDATDINFAKKLLWFAEVHQSTAGANFVHLPCSACTSTVDKTVSV